MLNLEGSTLTEVDEALAHIANARRTTTKDCRLRAIVSEDIDDLLDRRLVLLSEFGPMHQRVLP